MQEHEWGRQEDGEAFRRVWQRVQMGREEAEQGSREPGPSSPPPWDPVPFLQDTLVQLQLREGLCRRWRALAPLGEVYRGQGRRLAAALFLLRGIRPLRRAELQGQSWPSLEESCRQLFLWERRGEQGLRTALSQTGDPDLRALFQELIRESTLLQQRVRVILEAQMG